MVKKVFALVFSVLLAQGFVGAQYSMQVPYGSFEQWTSHSGYSVTALFIPVSVYSSFSTPTGWDYLSYPVNETVTVLGSNININTNLPLIKASQETGTVPNGSSAVKLQTFMLSDIISSTVYSVASGSIDTMLTNMVFPSIISTGLMDIDHFIPIMNSLMSNMDSMEALLTSLADEDVNYYFDGGVSLNGFVPTRLTGSYKYHSAVSGDNGGVLILGTRYNSTLNKRELVGGGVNIDLTDCTGYTPFTVDYMSLHDYDATYPLQEPDSLIIMLISSASLNRQQGSWLCIDSLVLWHDTCPDIVGATAVPDIHEAVLSWSGSATVSNYELEYGVSGFALGSGTHVLLNSTSTTLFGLSANTHYDVYLRTVCNDNIYGDWDTVSFLTNYDSCASIIDVVVVSDIHEASASWGATSPVEGFELVYGEGNSAQTYNNPIILTGANYTITGLDAESPYWVAVRAICGDSIYGEWEIYYFTTLVDTCAGIANIAVVPDINEATVSWSTTGPVEGFELVYGEGNNTQTYNNSIILSDNNYIITGLNAESQYWVAVRAVCGDSLYGEWEVYSFTTLADTCVDVTDVVVVPGIHEATVSWSATGPVESYELVCDETEFNQTFVYDVIVRGNTHTVTGLEDNHMYWIGIRAICDDSLYGEWSTFAYFTTLVDTTSTEGIDNSALRAQDCNIMVSPNPASGHCVVELFETVEAELRLYSADGRLLENVVYHGDPVTLVLPSKGVFLLQATTVDGSRVRKIVNR